MQGFFIAGQRLPIKTKKENPTMKTETKFTHHPANSRGHANHGWLNSYHTFSFAGYHHPQRMHFGALRVLNDDTVAAGMGFSRHPHDNMEIMSIPTYGDLKHKDSMGNETIIRQGDVQIMSAGTGVSHSEMNANKDKEVRFFQIWILPRERNIQPAYGQITLDTNRLRNNLLQVVGPYKNEEGLWINQNAWFHLGHLDDGFKTIYPMKDKSHGLYVFVIEGSATVAGDADSNQHLQRRDGLGIENTGEVSIMANGETQLLLMEVPMTL
jgi:hypothetical protein